MNHEIEIKQLRHFGLMVGAIFVGISVWPVLIRGQDIRWWALVLGGVLIVPALVLPRSLRALNRVWMTIGHALGWVNTRIVLGIILYGVLTPMGLAMRLMGRDPMHRSFDRQAYTYRVVKRPRPASHMRRQF